MIWNLGFKTLEFDFRELSLHGLGPDSVNGSKFSTLTKTKSLDLVGLEITILHSIMGNLILTLYINFLAHLKRLCKVEIE